MGIDVFTVDGECVGADTFNSGTKSFEDLGSNFDITDDGSVFDDTGF